MRVRHLERPSTDSVPVLEKKARESPLMAVQSLSQSALILGGNTGWKNGSAARPAADDLDDPGMRMSSALTPIPVMKSR